MLVCFLLAACHALCLLQCDRSLPFLKGQEGWSMMFSASLWFLYGLCSSSLEHARATGTTASPCSSNSTYVLQLPAILPKMAFYSAEPLNNIKYLRNTMGPICNTTSVGNHDSSQRSLERDTGNDTSFVLELHWRPSLPPGQEWVWAVRANWST